MEQNTGAHALEYAGFWRRFGAFVVDAMLISIVISMIFPLGSRFPLNLDDRWYFIPLVTISNALSVLATLAYSVIFWCWRGQTLGKMLLNIRLLRGDGSDISFGYAMLRYLGYVVCILTLGGGFLWLAFDSRKQGLHDKIAGTVVVKLPDAAASDAALANLGHSTG
ncbi:MAG: RDD family protein [Dehalococcoidia bacterium]|nr:RDD family protein [Dehalococcoidia bacterium]